jgi:hypothetical protein
VEQGWSSTTKIDKAFDGKSLLWSEEPWGFQLEKKLQLQLVKLFSSVKNSLIK